MVVTQRAVSFTTLIRGPALWHRCLGEVVFKCTCLQLGKSEAGDDLSECDSQQLSIKPNNNNKKQNLEIIVYVHVFFIQKHRFHYQRLETKLIKKQKKQYN